jgi:hypothetical protein
MPAASLLGWSNGAQAVLATIDASRPWPGGTPTVDRAVAFYPGCKRAVQQHNFRLRSPLLLLIGGADDWTPATRCAMLQNAVQSRQPGARFRLEIYPGAYHGFDGTSELHVRRDDRGAAQQRRHGGRRCRGPRGSAGTTRFMACEPGSLIRRDPARRAPNTDTERLKSGLRRNTAMQWEVVIGLETHTQLSTASKIFSGTSTAFGAEPNTQASPVDLALPGVLPVLNRGAVERAIQFGLAIGATIAPRSIFARKNYFYPDLPKGYQISQYEIPVVQGGRSRSRWKASRASTRRPST